jgi:hypothetical protein
VLPSGYASTSTFTATARAVNKARLREQIEDSLLEEDLLILGVLLGVLAEALVLDERHVGATSLAPGFDRRAVMICACAYSEDMTHGNIINVLVFLSSYCAGPFHLRHCHGSAISATVFFSQGHC